MLLIVRLNRRDCESYTLFRNAELGRSVSLFVPNALAAPVAFEQANGLSLLGIEELMGEPKGGGTCLTVKKPIPRRCRLIGVRVHNLASY